LKIENKTNETFRLNLKICKFLNDRFRVKITPRRVRGLFPSKERKIPRPIAYITATKNNISKTIKIKIKEMKGF